MSVTASGSAQRLDIGQTLQDVVNVFTRNLGPLTLLGVLLVGAPLSAVYLGSYLAVRNPIFALLAFVGLIGSIVGRPILFGAVVFMTVRELDGEPATVAECVKAGRRRWGSVLGLMIVTGLAIGVGTILLLVPGVYLALKWAVAGPSKVLTGRGISDAMEHSTRLTAGRRWAILAVYLVVLLVVLVLAVVLGLIEEIFTPLAPKALVGALTEPLPNVCTELALPVVAAVLYRRLRDDVEGAPVATLAEVFA
jgi:hypothetical protein